MLLYLHGIGLWDKARQQFEKLFGFSLPDENAPLGLAILSYACCARWSYLMLYTPGRPASRHHRWIRLMFSLLVAPAVMFLLCLVFAWIAYPLVY